MNAGGTHGRDGDNVGRAAATDVSFRLPLPPLPP
jgi:hypothetical protein